MEDKVLEKRIKDAFDCLVADDELKQRTLERVVARILANKDEGQLSNKSM